jgi:hypothetical protein
MTSREYQLVLEFAGDSPANFERITAIEEKLYDSLSSGEVDGNDVGEGIVNIFIITKSPEQCFHEVMSQIQDSDTKPDAAGYRDLDGGDYIRLWPHGDSSPFKLK